MTQFIKLYPALSTHNLNADLQLTLTYLMNKFENFESDNLTDKNGELCLIYTRANLAQTLNRTRATVGTYMKKLGDLGFLREKRQGQGKPNLIYIIFDKFMPEKQNNINNQLDNPSDKEDLCDDGSFEDVILEDTSANSSVAPSTDVISEDTSANNSVAPSTDVISEDTPTNSSVAPSTLDYLDEDDMPFEDIKLTKYSFAKKPASNSTAPSSKNPNNSSVATSTDDPFSDAILEEIDNPFSDAILEEMENAFAKKYANSSNAPSSKKPNNIFDDHFHNNDPKVRKYYDSFYDDPFGKEDKYDDDPFYDDPFDKEDIYNDEDIFDGPDDEDMFDPPNREPYNSPFNNSPKKPTALNSLNNPETELNGVILKADSLTPRQLRELQLMAGLKEEDLPPLPKLALEDALPPDLNDFSSVDIDSITMANLDPKEKEYKPVYQNMRKISCLSKSLQKDNFCDFVRQVIPTFKTPIEDSDYYQESKNYFDLLIKIIGRSLGEVQHFHIFRLMYLLKVHGLYMGKKTIYRVGKSSYLKNNMLIDFLLDEENYINVYRGYYDDLLPPKQKK
ncbi:hypothetical protein AN639_03655 [Candidatus Epulonipiscium fishelsonii]|uniref:Uncharacterized protein n=1 Tax=Candidatus Epulonipiscium fishelsonii TaxID=77094 RepID=A0ACC8X6N2_9FIRM|nr:hypothetical protein AN396_12870 [Epulopiscium sp. SCG-B11WGA-EpuloA1]ONI41457.1 hypothetical protein AN639_03655 [Epulopiscium sp. SCG-B05WGA-EpuloA1]